MKHRFWLFLPLLAASLLSAEAPSNVILITLDTTRKDALSCYGQRATETPALDRFNRVAHQFMRAYTPVPQTLPAHASLLTGLNPFDHGLRDNHAGALDPSIPTLATILKARGYHTAAVIASVVLDGRFGLRQGFERYDDAIASSSGQRRADEVTARALDQLAQMKPPFFLWVHYYDPHYPYDPPGQPNAPNPYLAEVRFMDGHLAALLDRIDLATSLVVVAGDHGEMLGEHREEEHGILLYEAAVQVPLMIHLPAQKTAHRHDAVVSLASVYATVLETLKIPNPSSRAVASVFFNGAAAPVYLETYYPYFSFNWSPLRGLLWDGYKLILSVREEELYRPDRDPREEQNLSRTEKNLLRRMKEKLNEICPEKTLFAASRPEGVVPADLQKQLESLGYLAGAGAGGGRDLPPELFPLPREVADIGHFVTRLAPRMLKESREREVLAQAKETLKRDPYNLLLIVAAGTATMQLGNLERALNVFREGLKIAPSSHILLGSMGKCLDLMDRPDEAEEYYKRAIQSNPRQVAYLVNLAQLYLKKKQFEKAQAVLDDARREELASPDLALTVGMLALARSDCARAIPAFEEVLREDPDRVEAMDPLAACHTQRGEYARAWDLLQRARRIRPKDFHLSRRAFEVALMLKKRMEARAIAAEFVSLFPMTEEARAMREIFPDLP